ncbi:unnamed protein product [Rotaria socialis]|uniref:Uncharacterized protein n=1 Tax=Rotaria socialis TaxID=392032 RepID=A0A821HBG7_9BILA|nr:unnamed protein product [Rotaria socialis]CAF4682470.1 unnamed protein product [Rotaria socialis]
MSSSWMRMFILIAFIYFFDCCFSSEKSYSDIEPCDSNRCRLPYCYCSNQSIPGGLAIRDTPQFIAININGPVNKNTYNLLKKFFFSKKYFNPDGCPISGTMFLKSHIDTNECLLRKVLQHGNIELSITSNSSECPTVDCRFKEKNDRSPYVPWRSYRLYNETIDYRRTLAKLAGLHSSSFVGYRSPNYEVNKNQLHWHILREHKFLYDSTLITQEWDIRFYNQQQPSPLTWPHTMDFAANYECSQGCYTQSFPGLWTIPIHLYQDLQGRNCTTIGSENCRVPRQKENFFKYLKYNLNRHLHSNHAPFIMAFDNYWLNEPYTLWRVEGLQLFIEHILRYHSNDVYFVRMIDIINWMKQPIGLEQMKEKYLSNIDVKSICNEQINIDDDDEEECFNGGQIQNLKSNTLKHNVSLFNLFDTMSEPLFRSNIVLYSTAGFCSFVIVTFIYDRFFMS